ncbi:MAG: cyclic nucleotide-binding domain-containing protein [Moorea sp. SIO2B7]|nr:cyclic nucleotide-binding domain-containing protein [Moorena sp. SIO2B7]
MVNTAIVSIQNLNYFFGEGSLKNQVLYDINLEIKPREFVILTGPSGSGKSTLLSLVGCLRSVGDGSLKILGQELNDASNEQRIQMRRNFGYITQSSNLLGFLKAWQNVQMSLELQPHLSRRELYDRSVAILEAVGLGDRINYYPDNLSGGQRQRVAIASALVSQPKLVLADEPTAALDKVSGRNAVALMQRLAKEQGSAILMVTHDNRILDLADRIINVEDGKLGFALNQEISLALPGFDETLLEKAETQPLVLTYSPGEVLVRQGDIADRFYILLEGNVEIFQENPNQPPQFLRRLGRGDYFGEVGLLQGGKRTATVQAAIDSEAKVVVVEKELFQLMINESELTSTDIARRLHQRVMTSRLTQVLPNLDLSQIEEAVAQVEILRYGPNSNIVQAGDRAQRFYLIAKGRVEILTSDTKDEETRSYILSTGGYFGEKELVTGQPYTLTARVMQDSEAEVMVLPGQVFLRLIRSSQTSQTEVATAVRDRLMSSESVPKSEPVSYQLDGTFKPNIADSLLNLDPTILAQAKTNPTIKTYDAGETIVQQGDTATEFYMILMGTVEVWQEFSDRPSQFLRQIRSGEYFSELGLLQGGTRTATVRAIASEGVAVMVISEDLFRLLLSHSQLTYTDVAYRLQEGIITNYMLASLPNLNLAEIAEVATHVKVRRYGANSTIVQQGDLADAFYLVAEGQAECFTQGSKLQKTLQVGDYFGASESIDRQEYPFTVCTSSDTKVEMLILDRESFYKLLVESKASPEEVAEVLKHRLIGSQSE